ncbi:MAG: hypothetical protein ACLGIB_12570 [Actinomycetota bacterium]
MKPPSLLERAARPFRGLSAATFAGLSRLRGHRVFHPYGESFDATLTFERNADRWLPDVLARPRRHDAIVRFSRAVGLPEPLPDIIGMAIKLPDLYGTGWDQDWLLVTSGADPVSRHLLLPTLDLLGRPYSTILPYRRPGGSVTFGARATNGVRARSLDQLVAAVQGGRVEFAFTIAPEGGDHVRLGGLLLTGVSATPERPLRFNPWNTSSELRPAGALNDLRRETYKASQRARPDS